MTKADIVNEVSSITGKQKKDVVDVIDSTMHVIKKNMTAGENVYLRGFGNFILKKRAEKKARNITAGTSLIVPEHYIPKFKPCRTFMDWVRREVNCENKCKTQ
jgi:DNA-binding protein HU-beta